MSKSAPFLLLFTALATDAAAQPAPQCVDWSTSFAPAGVVDAVAQSTIVSSLVEHDDGSGNALYLAGAFAGAGDVLSSGVARWNGTRFEALGGGLGTSAHSLRRLDLGQGPELYALVALGGSNLVRWDGSAWIAVPGATFSMRDVAAFDFGTGPQLVAAAQYPGGAAVRVLGPGGWTQIGPGPEGDVLALEVYDDGAGPALYAAGVFATAGGVTARGIARWYNGAGWVEVGGGLRLPNGNGASGLDLCVWNDGTRDLLVVAGSFWRAGITTVRGVAAWDGTSWSTLGAGVDGDVVEVEPIALPSGSKIAVAGGFTHAGGAPAASPALFGLAGWTSLGGALTGLGQSATARAFAAHDDGTGRSLFVGGNFVAAGGTAARGIARWDESAWHALGVARGVAGTVLAIARHDDGSGPALYAGGDLTAAGDKIVRQVARYDGAQWSAVGPVTSDSASVLALVSADVGAGRRLYAAGEFTRIAGTNAAAIAAWNGSAWAPLPGGGLTYALDVARGCALAVHDDGSGPALYVAGAFDRAGGVPAASVARWTPAGWSAVGAGIATPVTTRVSALAVFDVGGGPRLYAGGSFPGQVARWDGAAWQLVPGAPANGGGHVLALAEFDDGASRALFVGGRYSSVGGVDTFAISAWTGSAWRTFGAGATGLGNGQVAALLVLDDGLGAGARLYAAGRFASVDGVAAASVAAWDGAQWSAVGGGGVGGSPPWSASVGARALGALDDGEGPSLYAGGDFTITSAAIALGFARCGRHGLPGCEPATGASACDGSGSGAACPCANPGLAGRGCANSSSAIGARLSARGAANVGLDSVTLDVEGTTPSAALLFFQGTSVPGAGAGVAFGDGVRCAGGSQVRLAIRAASGGAASFGAAVAGDAPVSVVGGVGGAATRHYQVWYRDAQPAWCTSATFNLSNGLAIRWAP